MLYILAGLVGMCALSIVTELLIRAAERTAIMDKLFRLFDLPEESADAEKKSAPNAATSEGTKVIYFDEIVAWKGGAVK